MRKQKETYPHIELILVLPYLNRDIDTSRYDSTTYLQAFREARAEMKSSQPALPVETSVDIRA